MKKLTSLSAEMVVSIAATIISICALSVSVIETRLMLENQQEQRVYQRASVWPNLSFRADNDEDALRLYIVSNGVGLAKVESFEIMVDGKAETKWLVAMEKLYGAAANVTQHRNLSNTAVLPPGTEIKLLTLDTKGLSDVDGERFTVAVCYCSVYNECFKQTHSGRGTPVEQCAN